MEGWGEGYVMASSPRGEGCKAYICLSLVQIPASFITL